MTLRHVQQTHVHVPGRVAGVGEGEVAHAQLVHHPQRAEAVADAVPTLDGDEAGDLGLLEHPPDVCGRTEKTMEINIFAFLIQTSCSCYPEKQDILTTVLNILRSVPFPNIRVMSVERQEKGDMCVLFHKKKKKFSL